VNPDGDEGNSPVSQQLTVMRERDGERGRWRDFAESDGDPRCPDSDEGEGERRRDFAESDSEGGRRREGEGERKLT
jgi:hypothetical protein